MRARLRPLLDGDTARAAELAAATLAGNGLAVVLTIVFTRLLGNDDYGSFAALISAFTILAVVGSALQVAVARDTALGRLGELPTATAALRAWSRVLALALLVLTALSILARDPVARLMGVGGHPWAAAAVVPTAVLWLGLSLQRGVLQGVGAYRPVAASIVLEAAGRLVVGVVLVVAGAGVLGAYLGTTLALAITGAALAVVLHRRTGGAHAQPAHARLGALVRGGWAPVLALFLLAALQNVDVIVAKRDMASDAAGAYAAAVVAAKLVVWVAIGIGLHLLPEATRRAAGGQDPRPVLLRALGILAVIAAPSLAIFALVPGTLLRVAFGEEFVRADSALLLLGLAMTLLAAANLAVQYLLALGRLGFLPVLAAVAVAEPILLRGGTEDLVSFARIVLLVQGIVAVVTLALAGWTWRARAQAA